MSIDENYLYAVVSLPAGVFQPYSGVKTSILFLDKTLAKKNDEILFVKVENDGFDLGAQRRRIEKNDLPQAFEMLRDWQKGRKIESKPALWVKKKKIAENGDYNLTGDRYREAVDYSKVKWPMVKLGEVAEVISGQSPPGKYYNDKGEGIPFYQGKTEFTEKVVGSPKKWTTYTTKIAVPDDILMSVRAPVGPVNFTKQEICIGRGLAAIRCNQKKINHNYLFFLLKEKESEIQGNKGAAFSSINRKDIQQLKIPLPPLEVQKEIVAELDSYQKVVDGARQVAENWKPRIKINPDWPMVRLGEVCENLDGKRIPITKSDRKPGKYPYYGASGIVDYVHDFIFDDNLLLISEDGANLLARVTPIASSVSGKIWVNNHAHVLKFRHIESQKYVETYVNLIDIKNYVTGMAQPKLNQKHLNSILIPFPSVETQKQIVTEIEAEQKMVKECKKLIIIHEQKIKDKIAEVWGEE